MADKAHGKGDSLSEAFEKAGQDAHNKWPKGQEHDATAQIEVTLTKNPGAVKEYRVTLTQA